MNHSVTWTDIEQLLRDKCLLNAGPFPPRKQDTGIETPFSLVDICSPEAAATTTLIRRQKNHSCDAIARSPKDLRLTARNHCSCKETSKK